jgi:5-formyltetrahydrofolate cyclo-ligase
MTDTSIEKLKSVFRKNLKDQREQVSPQAAQEASQSVWVQLKEESFYKKSKRIAAFVSSGTEINTRPLLEGILGAGKELYLPRVDMAQTLIHFHAITNLNNLTPGPYNIPEPKEGVVIAPEQLDLILIPGLAFDSRGHRLGYGKGYYDRFLPLLRLGCFKLGVAYACQIIDKTPNHDHDIPVNAVLTEKYILLC